MNMVRQAIEASYTDTCTVYECQKLRAKGVVKTEEAVVLENQPCRLSFKTTAPAGESDTAAPAAQTVKLFVAPEVEIKAGSKIVVEHCGRTYTYTRSGIPALYETHQEILLEAFKEWA